MIIDIINGDLLDATESYIAQQTNCNTVTAHGLSKSIAQRWKHGDVYSQRSRKGQRNAAAEPDEPGSVVITEPGPGSSGPIILHMMAQWTPGKAGAYNRYYPKTYQDTARNREGWFLECLNILDDEVPKGQVVAMPYCIGCGLAGGKWETYKNMLESCITKIRLYRK